MSRTHRVNLDWLCERIRLNSNISVTYVHTNQQFADMLTKGSFTRDEWSSLTILFGIVCEYVHRSPFSVVAALVPFTHEMAKRSPRHQRQFQKEKKKLSHWPQCDIRKALICIQEKTQSDVRGQVNQSQASGDRLHFPGVRAGRPVSNGSAIQCSQPGESRPGIG